MGCVASRTRVDEQRGWSKQPAVPSALPSYGVEMVLDAAKSGDTVSFIHMPAGTRRDLTFVSRTIRDGCAGFTGRNRSGKIQFVSVKACREMYIPPDQPGLRARQISVESEGSEAS